MENVNVGENKQSNIISKGNSSTVEKKREEIRTINMQKQIKANNSGEFILNHLYKHKKSINQIRKETSKNMEESPSINNKETVDINIAE